MSEVIPKRWTRIEKCKALLMLAKMLQESPDWRMGISSDTLVMLDIDATDRICRIWWRWIADWLSRFGDVAVFKTERGYHLVLLKPLKNKQREIQKATAEIGRLEAEKKRLEKKMREVWRLVARGQLTEEEARREVERMRRRIERLNEETDRLKAYIRYLQMVREPGVYWEDVYQYILDSMGREPVYAWEKAFARCVDRMHAEISLRRHYTTLRISAKPRQPYDIFFHAIIRNGEVVRRAE